MMIKKLLRDQRGSAVMFELAFVLFIMVIVFYGYTLFTNGMAVDLALKTAAREGAREYAFTNNSIKGIEKAERELAGSKVNGAIVTSFSSGSDRGIKIEKKYGFTIPFIGEYGPTLRGYGVFIAE